MTSSHFASLYWLKGFEGLICPCRLFQLNWAWSVLPAFAEMPAWTLSSDLARSREIQLYAFLPVRANYTEGKLVIRRCGISGRRTMAVSIEGQSKKIWRLNYDVRDRKKNNLMSWLKLLCCLPIPGWDCVLSWWYTPTQEAGYVAKSSLINLLCVWALQWHHRRHQEGCEGERMLMNQQHDSCAMGKHLWSCSEKKVRKPIPSWIFADIMNFHTPFCFFFAMGHGLLLSQ